MKKLFCLVMSMILALTLCACRREEPVAEVTVTETMAATEAPTEVPGDPVLEAYRQVLAGETIFIDVYSGAPLQFDSATHSVDDNWGSRVTPLSFSLLDLDQDGELELILRNREGSDFWRDYWVLKYRDGTVFSYETTYRYFDNLKADGTMEAESGEYVDAETDQLRNDYGIGRMSFSDTTWGTEYIAKTEVVLTQEYDPISVTHIVNGEETTEEAFRSARRAQEEKPDAVWYAFSEENLARVGIGDAPYCDSGKMVDILSKNGVFYERHHKMYMSLKDFAAVESARAEADVALTRVTAMDLFGGGEKDVVLWITQNGEDAGALFLHNDHGVIQGLAFDHSMFNSLKADGTILWGGSELYYGASHVILEDPYQYQDDIHRYHDYGDGVEILVNGNPGSKEAFLKAMEAERAKPDAEWIPYPCEDPEELFQ